ncbi:hypothetical protein IHQ75_04360 [Bifidobacterium dentium]|uniref:phage terminase small subunit n=1 Tax=Bifidobacterium dentium TaxID=1689 RepID=UPI0018C2E343|nr:hypothetical protein [Bifidobacterium dentium]MBF9710201.1 hypothetical protein [Bifidobacterium dentium]
MEQPQLPSEVNWGEQTLSWWASLASVVGVDGWTAADWQFAMDTALVHDAVWNGGELKYMQELRQREQALGITPAARLTKSSVEVAVEKVTETPLQRITERRIERRNASRKSTTDVSA